MEAAPVPAVGCSAGCWNVDHLRSTVMGTAPAATNEQKAPRPASISPVIGDDPREAAFTADRHRASEGPCHCLRLHQPGPESGGGGSTLRSRSVSRTAIQARKPAPWSALCRPRRAGRAQGAAADGSASGGRLAGSSARCSSTLCDSEYRVGLSDQRRHVVGVADETDAGALSSPNTTLTEWWPMSCTSTRDTASAWS